MFLIILKALFLTLGMVYAFSNVGKLIIRGRNSISITGLQIWLMSIGIVGFITLQYWLEV